jgi:hypothetical protein
MAKLTPNQADRQAATRQAAAAAEAARQRAAADRQREAARAASAKAAADRAEAARQTKAQVERAERAEAERIAWILKNGPRGADAMDAWLKSPGYKPAPTTTKPSPSTSTPARPSAPAVDQAALDRAAQLERDRIARLEQERLAQLERDRLAKLEQERLARLEKERLAAIERARQEAIARMPVPLPTISTEPVKYATPDVVLIDPNDVPIDLILKLTLEKIGGLELINLVRHDTVNGQNIIYRPLKNVSQLAIDYNPQNMIKLPDSADSYFKNFAIKLENHIQQETNELPALVTYIDPVTENVIIETTSMRADYEVEVQMVSSGKVFDDTIYTEDYS